LERFEPKGDRLGREFDPMRQSRCDPLGQRDRDMVVKQIGVVGRMPTFIDESGDPGPEAGSSRHFRLSAVWFESRTHVDEYLDVLAETRRGLRVSPFLEFHFAAITHERRIAFFEGITKTHFYFAVSGFRKDDHDRRSLTKSAIQEATIDGLVRHLQEWYLFAEEIKAGNAGLNEKIVYDECQDTQYVRTLKSSFRTLKSSRGANKKLVDDVRPGKSKSDGCLQLADMVLGAVGRHLDGDNVYYDYIRSRMIGISLT
jgi:hypothetical protein